MSMTAMVKEPKRALIPAVTHVDGSSRLQTVTAEAEPFYHKLISEFFKRTDVPMVLNTSFIQFQVNPSSKVRRMRFAAF
jgi:carbamoyltransferase